MNERERVRWAFFTHPRHPDGYADSLQELRNKIPPVISRKKLDPVEPLVRDVLVFDTPAPSAKHRVMPPSLFDPDRD